MGLNEFSLAKYTWQKTNLFVQTLNLRLPFAWWTSAEGFVTAVQTVTPKVTHQTVRHASLVRVTGK